MSDAKPKKKSPMVPLITGAISGGIECISVWPMEYIKTQLQLQKNVKGVKPPFTGVIEGLSYTVRTTGFLSLYNGLGVTLVGSIPKAGIRFGGNAYFKGLLADDMGKLTMAKQFLAGMGAGTLEAIFAVTPMETIKTKLIETNQSLVPGVRSILAESGFAGLYQGVFATVLKQSSNQGLRFMFFNKYKDIVTDNGKTKLHPLSSLVGGMAAGCFSVLGNNPFDVVKTQMQGKDAKQYKSTIDCFAKIFNAEGIRGLYRGAIPRMGRVVPGQGVIFMSFETIQGSVEKLLAGEKL
ncbi:mitochondriale tricarboxylate carrier protein [Ochromonadaceae sp. CCMP2298]|nr:mitochondriale tricarboxylate carrier protein [Ochromonadaceae sp. CCMP2298]